MPAGYSTSTSSNGTTTVTLTAVTGVTWTLTSLVVSQAGPTSGVNAKVTVWDGAVGSGTALFTAYLNGPGAVGTGIGSVGTIQEVPLPTDAQGRRRISNTPGNALNVQVTGTGVNQVAVNLAYTDGAGS